MMYIIMIDIVVVLMAVSDDIVDWIDDKLGV